MKSILTTLLLAVLGCTNPHQTISQSSAANQIEEVEGTQHSDGKEFGALTLVELMDRFGVPGVGIAVIKDYKIHWAKGYGIADVETGRIVDNKTLFQAASISKPVNAMALLKAAQDGKFSVDDDINTILQLALTDAIGRPYPEILQEYVLEPVGMRQSTFEQPLSSERDANAARAHNGNGKAMGAKWHVYPELAAAGLWTTPTDLAKFAIEVQKSLGGKANHVLSQTMIKEMLSPVGVGDFMRATGLCGEHFHYQTNLPILRVVF